MSKKILQNDVMDFLIHESAKITEELDDKTIDLIMKEANIENFSKNEFRRLVNERKNISKSTKTLPMKLDASLQSMYANQNLTTAVDPILHFSPSHLGFLKRIFNMQITQNYLNALKFFITDDHLKKQTAFNVSTQNSIEHFLNIINELKSKHQNQINELESKHQNQINDTLKFNIFLVYQQICKKEPLSWEINCWKQYCLQNNIHNLINILKIPEMRKKIQQDYLKTQGFSFPDENSAIKKIDGHTIYFSSNDYVLFEIFSQDESYEKTTVKTITKLLKKGSTVLNIGANVGYHTLLTANLVGTNGKVFAFEPFPENIQFLEKNVDVNGYDNVEIIPKAVSNKVGITNLWLKESGTWHFISSKKISDFKSCSVDTISIDEFLKNKKINVDFAIIDAEGSEKFILEGMKQTIQENPNLEIIIEYNPFTLKSAGSSGKSLLDLITALEYSIYVIDEINDKLQSFTNDQILREFPENSFTNLYLTKK